MVKKIFSPIGIILLNRILTYDWSTDSSKLEKAKQKQKEENRYESFHFILYFHNVKCQENINRCVAEINNFDQSFRSKILWHMGMIHIIASWVIQISHWEFSIELYERRLMKLNQIGEFLSSKMSSLLWTYLVLKSTLNHLMNAWVNYSYWIMYSIEMIFPTCRRK